MSERERNRLSKDGVALQGHICRFPKSIAQLTENLKQFLFVTTAVGLWKFRKKRMKLSMQPYIMSAQKLVAPLSIPR